MIEIDHITEDSPFIFVDIYESYVDHSRKNYTKIFQLFSMLIWF